MTQRLNPATQHRRLRAELRQARADAGLSQQQVADALDWSLSKVLRAEHGAVKVSVTDLRALLVLYGITDPQRVDELVAIARLGKQQHWWDQYRNVVQGTFGQYLELESTAIRNRQYQSTTVPGLLQTREYATGVVDLYDFTEDELDQRVKLRMKRQQILIGNPDQEFFFVVDEAVLRRRIGTPQTMLDQLAHLKEVNRLPNVSIQVIQFSAGTHRAMRGSFTIVEVPLGIGDEVDFTVAIQSPHGDSLIRNDAEKASEYVEMFMALEAMAIPSTDLDDLIDDMVSRTS